MKTTLCTNCEDPETLSKIVDFVKKMNLQLNAQYEKWKTWEHDAYKIAVQFDPILFWVEGVDDDGQLFVKMLRGHDSDFYIGSDIFLLINKPYGGCLCQI